VIYQLHEVVIFRKQIAERMVVISRMVVVVAVLLLG
jgi:hypothetical protein